MKITATGKNCREARRLLDAYHDGDLSGKAAGEYRSHLGECPRCREAVRDYREVSRALSGLAREVGEGGELSLWPAVRRQLLEERRAGRPARTKRRFSLVLRPAWIGVGLSAAAALVIFFSGVLTGPRRLPENYCRIESISAPEHNLMIHQGESDGLTIIWLTE